MKTITVAKEDDGMRLNRFLERTAPGMSAGLMHRYLRTKRIKLNGGRCEASTRLKQGDVISLYINDELFEGAGQSRPDFMQAPGGLMIIYDDENISILYKPAGLLSHSTKDACDDTLAGRYLKFLYEKGEYSPHDGAVFTPALCNRLDRNTEGLVIAAKNGRALAAMNRMIKENRVAKVYRCAVSGSLDRDGVYSAHLKKDEKSNIVKVTDSPIPGSKAISTAFKTLAKTEGLSLIEAELITGRTHQIRAHLAHLGAPIVGDVKYGDEKINKKLDVFKQALCSCEIRFTPDKNDDAALYYLNGEVFSLENLWFEKLFLNS